MTRAKRIEEAARALEACFPDGDDDACWPEVVALRAALALPEEESVVGWTVRRPGESLVRQPGNLMVALAGEYEARDWIRSCWAEPAGALEAVRVRVTVEGEGGEP